MMRRYIKSHWSRLEIPIVLLISFVFVVLIFKPYFFDRKTLFPANLLVSAYSPWRYESIPEYPNGPPNKPIGFDNIRQFFPNRKLLHEEILKGVIPLWNPYIYSGTPFMASFDTAIWYPLSWIAALLPTVEGWNFLVIIQPFLSLFFMYLFLRSMKFSFLVSVFGGFAYAYSGWMIVYWQEILVLEHSILWLPLALYASNRLWERYDDRLGFTLLVLSLTFSVFGGFMQMSVYVYFFVVFWNIYCLYVKKRKKFHRESRRKIILALVISLLLASIQLIPSIEAFFLSPRGLGDGRKIFEDFLLPIQHLITLLVPDFWGNPGAYNYFGGKGFYFEKMINIGIIPLIFMLFSMLGKGRRPMLFWKVMVVVTLSMGFALPTSWLPYFLRIPVLANSYPTRIFSLFLLGAIILSCAGLEEFLQKPDRKRMLKILVFLTIILGCIWAFVLVMRALVFNTPGVYEWCQRLGVACSSLMDTAFFHQSAAYATVSFRNLIIPTMLLIFAWFLFYFIALPKHMLFIGLSVLTIFSSFYFARKYTYFSERQFVYPEPPVLKKLFEISGYSRVWGYGNAFIEKNISQYFRLFSSDGYGNLSSKRYAELLSTIANKGKLGGNIRRSDTDIYEASERDPFSTANPYRLRMMSLLGVSYILESKRGELKDYQSTDTRFSPDIFSLLWEDDAWRIWRYEKAIPRVVFARNALVLQDPQKIVDTLYNPEFQIDETIIIEKPFINPQISEKGVDEKQVVSLATIVSYTMNSVSIQTDSARDGFVLLTDNYYPGWRASVDGNPAAVYRADYSFKAVEVPKGKHTVLFYYMPVSFILGIGLSVIGVVYVLYILKQSISKGSLHSGNTILSQNKRKHTIQK